MGGLDPNTVKERLRTLLVEMREQPHLANHFGGSSLSFDEEMEQIREFIEDAGEYSIAYEVIVAALECVPFRLSGTAAVALLEVGLLLGYKTERLSDKLFDRRNSAE